MSIVFDPFTGQIIDTGSSGGMAVGGPVAGADPNSVLVVDGAQTLQDIIMPLDGQLLIGSAGNLPVAANLKSSTLSTNPKRIIISNTAGGIDLDLPQDISSADSPEFAGLTLTGFSGPIKATAGVLSATAIDLSTSDVTNILTTDKGGTGLNGSAAPNGHILIGNSSGFTLADILGTTNQVNITNGAGSIQLSLPQDIHTGASPEFFDLFLAGTVDTAVLGGTLAFGTNKAAIINIGSPTATVNIQGTTIYQNVTNLNISDKNITVNVGGSIGSGGGSGIHVEEGGVSNAGHAEVTGDRLGWEFHPPGTPGIAYIYPGLTGITIDQSSHDPVTIATPANGLAILNQELSLELSGASSTGALSDTDWNTFNGKQDALTFGSVSTTTTGVTIGNGTNSTVGPNVTIDIATADTNTTGLLTDTDWDTFNGKQNALTFGSISTTTTGVTIGNGTNSTVGPNVTVDIATATSLTTGLLTSTDWNTFNGKQDALPSQAGNSGKFLTTDGALLSWDTIPNSSLDNSSVTINGSSVSLGGSTTITASTTSTLTIGSGLTGGSFNGSTPITIAFDSSDSVFKVNDAVDTTKQFKIDVAGTTGTSTTLLTTQTTDIVLTLPNATDTLVGTSTSDILTNKTISGTTNTLSNIGNSSLTNSSITVNGTSISLGSSGTITANTTNALSAGSGIQFTPSGTFDGSVARTISVDATFGKWTITTGPTLGAGGTISISLTAPFQAFRVASSGGAVTLSSTPFGSSAPADATCIRLIGTSDSSTVELTNNDAAKGCLLNGNCTLVKGSVIDFMYSSTDDRYFEVSRNF